MYLQHSKLSTSPKISSSKQVYQQSTVLFSVLRCGLLDNTLTYCKYSPLPDDVFCVLAIRIAYVTLYFSGLFAFTQFFFQNQTYRGEHYSIPFSAFLILTARYSFVGKSILKRPLKLPTFSTVMFHVSIMSTVYILLSSI